jgi:transcriptional regulator with XRE-family HTH domain
MFISGQAENKNNAFVLNNRALFYTSRMKNRVKEFRKKKKMTQTELADAVGTSMRNIQFIEKGERGLERWIEPIAKALGVLKRDLIDEVSSEEIASLPDVLEKPSEGIAIHILDRLNPEELNRVLSRYGDRICFGARQAGKARTVKTAKKNR